MANLELSFLDNANDLPMVSAVPMAETKFKRYLQMLVPGISQAQREALRLDWFRYTCNNTTPVAVMRGGTVLFIMPPLNKKLNLNIEGLQSTFDRVSQKADRIGDLEGAKRIIGNYIDSTRVAAEIDTSSTEMWKRVLQYYDMLPMSKEEREELEVDPFEEAGVEVQW